MATSTHNKLGRGAPEAQVDPRSKRTSFFHLPSRLALTGIRTRILAGFVVMLALATLASVVVARQVLQSRLHVRIGGDLAQEANELRRIAAGNDPATGAPFGEDVGRIFEVYFSQNSPSAGEAVLTFVDGRPFLRSRPVHPTYRLDEDARLVSRLKSLRAPARGSADTPAGSIEYLSIPLKRDGRILGSFVVVQFRDVLEHPFDDAVVVTGVVGLAVLLIGSLLAWRMAEGVMRPVASLTQTARSISETDLTQRIEVRGHDELAGLAATLNAMLDRLERTLTGQRGFLDDAGHELRTPITIVRGHLELLEDDPEERRETLALVMDELDRMSRMVNDLILLSKSERPDFLELGPVEVSRLTDELLTKASAHRDARVAAGVSSRGGRRLRPPSPHAGAHAACTERRRPYRGRGRDQARLVRRGRRRALLGARPGNRYRACGPGDHLRPLRAAGGPKARRWVRARPLDRAGDRRGARRTGGSAQRSRRGCTLHHRRARRRTATPEEEDA